MFEKVKIPGITSRQIQTERLNTHILTSGPPAGTAVLFIHGDGSSAGVWDETMLDLPEAHFALAPDLRGFGTSEALSVDATLGLDDMVADLRSLVEAMGLCPFHIVGHSMGGGIAMKYAMAYSDELLSITLVDTMSPFGLGGSKGVDGRLVFADGAPGGAASVNPDFIRLLQENEVGDDDPMAPLNVIRQFYVKPPFRYEREETLLEAMLSTKIGDEWYPGNSLISENWPGTAPGDKGVVNACSRKYFDASPLINIDPKPPILWIRGEDDVIISDNSMWEIASLGSMGLAPDWPGADECPPQPMLQQTRAVLEQYAGNGGRCLEVVIDDAGHLPFIEKPGEFREAFHAHLLSCE